MRPTLVLMILFTYFGLAFGVRSVRHRRLTGSWGFHGISGHPGSPAFWGGVLFAIAILLMAAAPPLAMLRLEEPLFRPALTGDMIGAVAALVGIVGTWRAQSDMGRAWRIGVLAGEQTRLVMNGAFRWVRNPIFSCMGLGTFGLVLLLPSGSMILALICLMAGVSLQVRFAEEPHLLRVHGDAYAAYCRRVGRFLPKVGVARRGGADV